MVVGIHGFFPGNNFSRVSVWDVDIAVQLTLTSVITVLDDQDIEMDYLSLGLRAILH